MALDVQKITGTNAKAAARLCNFVTAQYRLLPAHEAWLDSDVQRVLKTMQFPWVDILGYASRRGSAAANLQLSKQRVEATKAKISTYMRGINFQIQAGYGEEESGPDESNNDGYYRAVEVYVYATRPPPLKPPKPITVSYTDFEIRVVGGGSASLIGQADNYFFQIVDVTRKLTAFYFYTGVGIGISIPKIPGPGSVTKTGPVTKFKTTGDAELHQFNSRASLYQDAGATLGSSSLGGTMRLDIKEIKGINGFVFTKPGLIPIEGGAGVQMPGAGSVTEGVLALASAVFPFTGY